MAYRSIHALLALGLIAAAGALSSLDVAGWTRLQAMGVAGWSVSLGLPLDRAGLGPGRRSTGGAIGTITRVMCVSGQSP